MHSDRSMYLQSATHHAPGLFELNHRSRRRQKPPERRYPKIHLGSLRDVISQFGERSEGFVASAASASQPFVLVTSRAAAPKKTFPGLLHDPLSPVTDQPVRARSSPFVSVFQLLCRPERLVSDGEPSSGCTAPSLPPAR